MSIERTFKMLREQRVVICCGAGGVGKTSSASAISVAAARMGRRVLALTIDPSKRLAEILGVERNAPEPVRLSDEAHRDAGIVEPGSLSAWMLDPQHVADAVVRTLTGSEEEAERLLKNRIYRDVTAMVAGMQEYTAVEALHRFVNEETYDFIVLDTPPSRNALDFLEAPARVGAFLDGRVFNLFLPKEDPGRLRRMAGRMIDKVLDRTMGAETRHELQEFFTLFGEILRELNKNAADVQKFFSREDVSFIAVTSPQQEAIREAFYFEDTTGKSLGVRIEGYVLSRSLAYRDQHMVAPHWHLSDNSTEVERSAIAKLSALAEGEREQGRLHRQLQSELAKRHSEDSVCIAMPLLSEGVKDMASLVCLADALTDPRSYPTVA